ncbi:MAG: glutamine synthetase III [Verrucomicrobia bacterium]|nr:glutamine synthetase III [Verrucomicrobiota bacterium]
MAQRDKAVAWIGKRRKEETDLSTRSPPMTRFGGLVFSLQVMQKMLPRNVYENVAAAIEGKEKIRPDHADAIAVAMKEWATALGATHFCHWFQPLTGMSAEKHDSFLHWCSADQVIEKFDGAQLIQGEPDASSFPSGGLRSTYEARGYTGWDPASFAFVWKGGDGITLFIPSVFYSWNGDVLDHKIPLLRTDQRLNAAVLRLLSHAKIEANSVYSTLGWEQEYFIIDRTLRDLRPDLMIGGRTLFGAPSPKGQELEDHYFAAIKDRVLRYMKDVEDRALELGIPLKTRHNEVAPAQHEFAAFYERSNVAVDHNLLLMELMRQRALQHDLACLLHEKPFAGVNGSGKHNNWSLATDRGVNLLDPGHTPEKSLVFLFLLTAVLQGVHRHADLLRASIGTAGNDFRLGANEAPPAVISIFLGEALERFLNDIEEGKEGALRGKGKHDLKIPILPDLPRDNTDRNRTSSFAFTGNKFEYRAVGSSANCAVPMTVLGLAVAEALEELLAKTEKALHGDSLNNFAEAALPVIRESLKGSRPIRFSGDNYSAAWALEAKKRNLPNESKSLHAFKALESPKAAKLFEGILTPRELQARFEVQVEMYAKTVFIEAKLMLEMFFTQIFPAAMRSLGEIGRAHKSAKEGGFEPQAALEIGKRLQKAIDASGSLAQELEQLLRQAETLTGEDLGVHCCDQIVPKGMELRGYVDQIERLTDDSLWPLPKYRELLFLV